MSDPKELYAKIQDHRKRIVAGEEVTDDEIRSAISALHDYRNSAHTSLESAAKKKGTAKAKAKTKAVAKAEAKSLLGGLL